NAGALVVADMLITHLHDPKQELLSFVQHLAGDSTIGYDTSVAASELAYGARNAALAHFLRSFGNIHNDVDAVLDLYFHQCAIAMSCRQLAHAFLCFANGGAPYGGGKAVLDRSSIKRLNALMQTCGFYDESGEFTYKVGLPGKSGVGGGIVAVLPGSFCVATWSPRLNHKGNSVLGMFALEELTTRSGRSIF
ncbi:MAG TPA: glutaminase, partial [Flavobacteriales bacterium]